MPGCGRFCIEYAADGVADAGGDERPAATLYWSKISITFISGPMTAVGNHITAFVCPHRRADLDDILMEDMTTDGARWGVDCNAFDADGAPVLFGCTCDMPRMKHFDNGLSLHDLKGTLICFDFQEDAMRAVCGPNVTLQHIDFDAYESQVFNSPNCVLR